MPKCLQAYFNYEYANQNTGSGTGTGTGYGDVVAVEVQEAKVEAAVLAAEWLPTLSLLLQLR